MRSSSSKPSYSETQPSSGLIRLFIASENIDIGSCTTELLVIGTRQEPPNATGAI